MASAQRARPRLGYGVLVGLALVFAVLGVGLAIIADVEPEQERGTGVSRVGDSGDGAVQESVPFVRLLRTSGWSLRDRVRCVDRGEGEQRGCEIGVLWAATAIRSSDGEAVAVTGRRATTAGYAAALAQYGYEPIDAAALGSSGGDHIVLRQLSTEVLVQLAAGASIDLEDVRALADALEIVDVDGFPT